MNADMFAQLTKGMRVFSTRNRLYCSCVCAANLIGTPLCLFTSKLHLLHRDNIDRDNVPSMHIQIFFRYGDPLERSCLLL
jgi:hypothetical protein